jgi:hypothetical protein
MLILLQYGNLGFGIGFFDGFGNGSPDESQTDKSKILPLHIFLSPYETISFQIIQENAGEGKKGEGVKEVVKRKMGDKRNTMFPIMKKKTEAQPQLL